jgi:uncharacterized membrane protein YgcG
MIPIVGTPIVAQEMNMVAGGPPPPLAPSNNKLEKAANAIGIPTNAADWKGRLAYLNQARLNIYHILNPSSDPMQQQMQQIQREQENEMRRQMGQTGGSSPSQAGAQRGGGSSGGG